MGKRLLVLLALALAVMPASPQNTWPPNAWPPVQVAQPDEKAAPVAEESVVVLPPQPGLLAGLVAVVTLLALGIQTAASCLDCGPEFPATTGTAPTGTR